jgi:hypothetical protein
MEKILIMVLLVFVVVAGSAFLANAARDAMYDPHPARQSP